MTGRHQPKMLLASQGHMNLINGVKCELPECHFIMIAGLQSRGTYEGLFAKHHAEQFKPGRAPDIEVEYAIIASCSVCGGVVDHLDVDTIGCEDCEASWDADGKNGTIE